MSGRIFSTGDIHGEMSIGKLSNNNWQEAKSLTKNDYLIINGDFGLLWNESRTKEEMYWLNWLDERPFTTLVVPGNHENHLLWNNLQETKMFGNRVKIISKTVFGLNRGICYRINGKKILTIGGATSHDKQHRIYGRTIWEEEDITKEDIATAIMSLAKVDNKVDYIITHCAPPIYAMRSMPLEMVAYYQPDVSEERLEEFFRLSQVEYKKHYCGHYHTDYGESYDGKFECLYHKIVELT